MKSLMVLLLFFLSANCHKSSNGVVLEGSPAKESPESQEITCCICLLPFKKSEEKLNYHIGNTSSAIESHSLHRECFLQNLSLNPTLGCPLCRGEISFPDSWHHGNFIKYFSFSLFHSLLKENFFDILLKLPFESIKQKISLCLAKQKEDDAAFILQASIFLGKISIEEAIELYNSLQEKEGLKFSLESQWEWKVFGNVKNGNQDNVQSKETDSKIKYKSSIKQILQNNSLLESHFGKNISKQSKKKAFQTLKYLSDHCSTLSETYFVPSHLLLVIQNIRIDDKGVMTIDLDPLKVNPRAEMTFCVHLIMYQMKSVNLKLSALNVKNLHMNEFYISFVRRFLKDNSETLEVISFENCTAYLDIGREAIFFRSLKKISSQNSKSLFKHMDTFFLGLFDVEIQLCGIKFECFVFRPSISRGLSYRVYLLESLNLKNLTVVFFSENKYSIAFAIFMMFLMLYAIIITSHYSTKSTNNGSY
jgi:hypothetical protein